MRPLQAAVDHVDDGASGVREGRVVEIAQRTFEVERPAPTADASGGVRALAEATDAAADQIGSWLRQR